jgi:acyl-homoserine lactone acylase PvdQ
MELLDESSLKIAQSYCDGINEYLSSKAYITPIEFTLGKFPPPAPWVTQDVLAVHRYLPISNLTLADFLDGLCPMVGTTNLFEC